MTRLHDTEGDRPTGAIGARRTVDLTLGRPASRLLVMGDSGHYFDESPDVASAPQLIRVAVRSLDFEMTTDRGVFGHGRLDRGTALLLETAYAPPPTGVLVDLGCGSGVIALVLAQLSPAATVWAVDVNRRALDLVRSNAERLGLVNVVTMTPDEVDTETEVATIWSNPPIRIGKERLHQLLDEWFARLRGEAWLVVHRHLGADSLHRWMTGSGREVERVTSRSGYRILVVRTSEP